MSCKRVKHNWKLIKSKTIGYVVIYNDDVYSLWQENSVLAVMRLIKEGWQCKLLGTCVRDDEPTNMAVERLVLLSITVYMVRQPFIVHHKK